MNPYVKEVYVSSASEAIIDQIYKRFQDEEGDFGDEEFIKCCTECDLIGESLSTSDAEAIFAATSKKGLLNPKRFIQACQQLASKLSLSIDGFLEKVTGRKRKMTTGANGRDDYEFVSDLGEGGFGTTIKVKQKKTGELFAAKRINCQGLES